METIKDIISGKSFSASFDLRTSILEIKYLSGGIEKKFTFTINIEKLPFWTPIIVDLVLYDIIFAKEGDSYILKMYGTQGHDEPEDNCGLVNLSLVNAN